MDLNHYSVILCEMRQNNALNEIKSNAASVFVLNLRTLNPACWLLHV